MSGGLMSAFIIAEIGINHNGNLDLARKLIDVAVEAGADAVKFQKRALERVYTKEELDMPRESKWGTTNRDQKAGLEFGKAEYDQIDKYCKEKDIHWFASAWDTESQVFLQQYKCKYNKVASARLTHTGLLNLIAAEGKHTFISTGMASLDEIEKAVRIFKDKGCSFELMHCTSTYPLEVGEINLKVMNLL